MMTHKTTLLLFNLLLLPLGLTAQSDEQAIFDPLIGPYLQIQTSLAADDLESAQEGARNFSETLEVAPATDDDVAQGMNESAITIAEAGNLAEARAAFRSLSLPMIEMAQSAETDSEKPLYLAHCPMAFGNEGGSWLQDGPAVANPFYGSMMLRCGSAKKIAEENP